jgi:hypothetical protein
MLGFDSLTNVAKSNILSNVSLHTIPPISGLEIMVHLIPFQMNGIRGLVSLTKYLILQLLNIRHTNPSLVSQHTFIIIQETKQFFFLDVVLYLLDLLIFQLAKILSEIELGSRDRLGPGRVTGLGRVKAFSLARAGWVKLD